VKQLLTAFGSVSRLKSATPDEISEVRGIGPQLATAVHERLRSD
jgi:excinuclease ABC subunit C